MKELLKKKGVWIGLLAITLLVVMGIIGTNAQSAQRRKGYNGHIAAAEKYLSDLDYEQAIAEYALALEIEPKSEEVLSGLEQTYFAYAGLYADAGDYEGAIAVLEEGYAVVQRESLKEHIQEYRELRRAAEKEAETEAEAEAETETDAAQDDDIKQMVESDEFERQLLVLVGIFGANSRNIADERVRELCRPMIEALERYRELYPENGWYYEFLPHLYYLMGEYELCARLLGEFRVLFPDNNNLSAYYKDENAEIIKDEYGRTTQSTSFFQNGGKQVSEYEYGRDGKLIRQFITNTSSSGIIATSAWEYEYDSEGRLSKLTVRSEDSLGSGISVTTFEYSGEGYTEYYNGENGSNSHRFIRNYVIDEYGQAQMVGETILEDIQ